MSPSEWNVMFDCKATLETWMGSEGNQCYCVDILDDTNNMANPPTRAEIPDQLLEAPTNMNWRDGWCLRLIGDYEFWIASDDEGEALVERWLMIQRIGTSSCRQPIFSGLNGWDDFLEQKSQLISLVAVQDYYHEVRLSACINLRCVVTSSLHCNTSFKLLHFFLHYVLVLVRQSWRRVAVTTSWPLLGSIPARQGTFFLQWCIRVWQGLPFSPCNGKLDVGSGVVIPEVVVCMSPTKIFVLS